MQILPAILARNEAEFITKLERVRSLGLSLHIDVMDGVFVPQTTWAPPDRVRDLLVGIPFEAHLMVHDPEHAVPVWLATGAERVIFHAEASPREQLICKATGEDCAKLCLAINPETPISEIVPFLDLYQHIMIMGVTPGASGQPFNPEVLAKMEEIARLRPAITLSIDGGMSPTTCKSAQQSGATRLIAGSSLTDSPDPTSALSAFRIALE